MQWLKYDGSNGIDDIFDPVKNKSKKHKGDDTLVPFKTKMDKNRYEDFSGVVGAFSRLMAGTSVEKNMTSDEFRERLREKIKDSDEFETLFDIIKKLYFRDGRQTPISAKSLSLIESNTTQRQVAEYLYSLFVDQTELKDRYQNMADAEDINALEKLVFEIFTVSREANKGDFLKSECRLPYIREVFAEDFKVLLDDADYYKANIQRFLAYYYMFYVTQLAVKLGKFEDMDRNSIEKIFMTLHWEGISRSRKGYEYGWKYVLECLSHMFSHAVLLQMLSHNVDGKHYDYLGIYEKFNNSADDEEVSEEIRKLNDRYRKWLPRNYEACRYSQDSSACRTLNEIHRLFDTIEYQFLNGDRISHYNGYNRKFIEFVQANFGRRRGTLGYTIGVNENDIIMFTQIILRTHGGKIGLSELYGEFDRRGLIFDKESKKKISALFEKMNLLEKRSDSGDAQYVKSVL